MQLLDGKYVSEKLKGEIAQEAANILAKTGRKPHLCAVLVGHDGGSETYVASKIKNCEQVGFKSSLVRYEADVTEAELLKKVAELNADADIDGIIVQLPLPKHIDPDKVTEHIDYRKDVDGFHPINLGRMQRNLPSFIPATPYGITLMLKEYGIETAGKHCVVVGRSNIVGSPMSILMARNTYPGNCTVTICHSKTPDIKNFTLQADILIVAIGRKNFITADMVKEGVVVVDVGMNRETSTLTKSGYKLYGDVDFENVAPKSSYITPVPGGVGLMTIIGLLKNTLSSANKEVYG
jgi:methylenetetrahydrofolate dehydrogenase (NADP+)/methenyltetrahydrofolate cyclohydrolase